MSKRTVFKLIKICIVLVLLIGFGLYFFQQQHKAYSDVLGESIEPTSSVPLEYTSVKGAVTEEQQKITSKQTTSMEQPKEDEEASSTNHTKGKSAATNSSETTTKEVTQQEMTQQETTAPAKKEQLTSNPNGAISEKASERQQAAAKGTPLESQQRTPEGTGHRSDVAKQEKPGEQAGSKETADAPAKEIVVGEKDTNPYFTTSITDGETVTKALYRFSITQKNPDSKVLQTVVTVNNILQTDFDGAVELQQGANTIIVQVTYDDKKAEVVERSYTVYYEENKLVIRTNLQDGLITNTRRIQFTAVAMFNESTHAVVATLDGETLVQNDEGLYEAALHEGINEFVLRAEKDSEKAEKRIRITYEKKIQHVDFNTDLKNAQVSSAELFFTAQATVDGKEIPMEAMLNNEALEEVDQTYYDLLQPGKNTVVLSATVDGEKEQETYTIYYQEPEETANSTVPDDKDGPKIVTDLKNGVQIRGSIKNMMIWATDSSGKQLPASGVAVTVNGKTGQMIWADSEKISYKLKLREGKNTVVVKAWDSEGRITTKSYTAYAKNIDEGKVIGTATISVEATTVGLGHLIEPTKVELHEGEKGSYVVDQLLRANGYTYVNTGTLDQNFYLASIAKAQLMSKVKIPSDLAKLVEQNAQFFDEASYSPNVLGEFDFSNGSGWMYSINGDYPNYGLADAYFLDGDVIRIRYTLFYGYDINGGGAMGNGSNADEGENTSEKWNKEW